MSELSSSSEAGAICVPCQEGNLFRLSVAPGASCPIPIIGQVNGVCTPALPENNGFTLQNTRENTRNDLSLQINGRTYPLVPDIRALGTPARAQSVGAHIIIKREPEPAIRPMVPIGQVSSARMQGQYGSIRAGDEMNALDVMSETAWRNAGSPMSSDGEVLPLPPSDPIVLVHEIDERMGPPPPPGAYDIDSMSDAEAEWFVSAIHYMTSDLAGDLTRSAGDAAFQTGDMLSAGNNRRFLREMIGRTVRVETLYNGAKVLIFESGQWDNGMLWYRRHLQYGSKGLGRMQVSSMNIAVRSVSESIGSNLRGMATKTGVVGLVFAVSFDIAEYLSSDGERFLSDLFVSIGFTVANAVLSTIIGTALAAAGIATVAIFGVAASPIIVAGIAIGAIVAVGFSLNRLVATTGVKTAAQNFFRNTDWYKSGLTDAEIYEGAMIAP